MAAWLDCSYDFATAEEHNEFKCVVCSPEGFDLRLDARARLQASSDPNVQYILESVELPLGDGEDPEVKRHRCNKR